MLKRTLRYGLINIGREKNGRRKAQNGRYRHCFLDYFYCFSLKIINLKDSWQKIQSVR